MIFKGSSFLLLCTYLVGQSFGKGASETSAKFIASPGRRAYHVHPSGAHSHQTFSHGWIPTQPQGYPRPHVHHPHPVKPIVITKPIISKPVLTHYIPKQPTPTPIPQPTAAPVVTHHHHHEPSPTTISYKPSYQPQPTYQPAFVPSNAVPSKRPKDDDQNIGFPEDNEVDSSAETTKEREPATQNPLTPRDYFPPPNIIGVLEDEEATTLLSLLEQADLLETLEGRGPFTVFAPSNEAFSKLDERTIRSLTDDRDLLRSVLEYHIVPGGKVFSNVIVDDLRADTLLDDRQLRFNVHENGIVTINGAELNQDKTDERAANGVIHFLDDVIYPIPVGSLYQVLNDDSRFVTIVRALEVADLLDLLDDPEAGPFTVFAPTDDAFDLIPREALNELLDDKNALTELLLKHVVKGTKLSPALTFTDLFSEQGTKIKVRTKKGQVYVNEAQLDDGDIVATNGAVQVIDRVLL